MVAVRVWGWTAGPGEAIVRVRKLRVEGSTIVEVLDDDGAVVEVIERFLRHLGARGCSPNTVVSYAYDLIHLWRFLVARNLEWVEMRPATSLELLEFLRAEPAQLRVQRFGLTTIDATGSPRLAPATVSRILTGVAAGNGSVPAVHGRSEPGESPASDPGCSPTGSPPSPALR